MSFHAWDWRDLRVATRRFAKLFIRCKSFTAGDEQRSFAISYFCSERKNDARFAVDGTRITVPLSKIFASRRPGNSVLHCTMEHVNSAGLKSGFMAFDDNRSRGARTRLGWSVRLNSGYKVVRDLYALRFHRYISSFVPSVSSPLSFLLSFRDNRCTIRSLFPPPSASSYDLSFRRIVSGSQLNSIKLPGRRSLLIVAIASLEW